MGARLAVRISLALVAAFGPGIAGGIGAGENTPGGPGGIVNARYAVPVDRYGHFALGRPHEYSRVVVTIDSGRQSTFELPKNEVFEDLAPRIVRPAADEQNEILAIVSARDSGSRLVMLRWNGDRLEISAQSPPIGTSMRWLNPVGVADLDGDGRAEIAAVITPHIGGALKVYRKQGKALVEIAALGGFSNHVYRSTELALSAPISVAGKIRLLVPDTTRVQLRVIGLENGRLVQTGRCALSAPITGEIRMISPSEVSVGLLSGREVVVPGNCPDRVPRSVRPNR